MKEQIIQEFKKTYNTEDTPDVYFAPGRVNLIGEHTDYNGGHVFPCALTMGTYGAVRKREDRKLRLYSMNFSEMGVVETSLDALEYHEDAGWTNYPKGTLWALKEKGYELLCGFDLLIYGNIPNGAGLSSSASLEVLTALIVRELYMEAYQGLTMKEIALIAQYGENHFNGVNCGIMDQFAVAMGRKNHAIFLDTASLNYEYAPLNLGTAKIVIACTNKKRGLADSAYNTRRRECETALIQMKKYIPYINSLGDLSEAGFEKNQSLILDPVCRKRARHAVYENQRTESAVLALKSGDLSEFGRLMNQSHISLRDDYEVTGVELDTLVEAAWESPGCIGSRMTGAGFGGCTVSIVEGSQVEGFINRVGEKYQRKIGYAADFWVAEPGAGARKL